MLYRSLVPVAIAALFLLLIPPTLHARDASRGVGNHRGHAGFLPGTIVLKLKETLPNRRANLQFGIPDLDRAFAQLGIAERRPLFPLAPWPTDGLFKSPRDPIASGGFNRIYVIRYGSQTDPQTAAALLAETGLVEFAEPYLTFPLLYAPNDPQLSGQYALSIIQAAQAWDVTKGDSNVVIGIIDSGVEWSHPDLLANIFNNPGESGKDQQGRDRSSNGVDDDNNGYVDDFHGWDLVGGPTLSELQNGIFKPDNNPAPVVSSSQNYQGYHGTWSSGCASAATDNARGIAGTGFRSKILPVKCTDDSFATGQVLTALDGIRYAADMRAKVINCSFGGEAAAGAGQAYQAVVDYAYAKGALVVAASGNFSTNNDEVAVFPANLNHVLSVGASTPQDSAAGFTHYGIAVKVYAPGVNILTTQLSGGYVSNGVSGTSFSSPITAGVAALVWAMHPDWTPDQVAMQIRATADNLKVPSGAYAPFFHKRVNAYRAVNLNKTFTGSALTTLPGLELTGYTINGKATDTLKGRDQTATVQLRLKNLLAPTRNLKIASIDGQVLTTNGQITLPKLGTLEETDQELTVGFAPGTQVLYSEGNIPLILLMTDGAYEAYVKVEIPISIPGWKKQFDPPTAQFEGSSIKAVSNQVAWGAGNVSNVPYITRTLNGNSWSNLIRVTSAQEPIYAITGRSSQLAWVGTGPTSGQAAVYRTSNGGTAWTRVSVAAVTGFVNGIHFFDDQNGIVFGDPLNNRWGIGITTDGGASWEASSTLLSLGKPSEIGWNNAYAAVGDNLWFGTNNSRIYYSTNRGASWNFGITPTVNSFGVAFANESDGLATFNQGSDGTGVPMVAVTRDGGKTWDPTTLPFNGALPQSVTFVPGTTRAFVATQAGIFETSDFGASWKQMAAPVMTYQSLVLSAQADTEKNVSAFGINAVGQTINLRESAEPTQPTAVPTTADAAAAMVASEVTPNPATGIASVELMLPHGVHIEVALFDLLGRQIGTIAEGAYPAGRHSIAFDCSTLPAGSYYCGITANGLRLMRKTVVGK